MFSILVKAPTNKYLLRKEYQKGHHYYTTEQTASHRGIFTTSRANNGVSSPSTGTSVPPVKSYKQHTMWNLYTTVPPDILISIFNNESYNKKGLKIWGTIWCLITKKKEKTFFQLIIVQVGPTVQWYKAFIWWEWNWKTPSIASLLILSYWWNRQVPYGLQDLVKGKLVTPLADFV